MMTTMKMTIGMTMVLRERLWRSTARLWTTTMERTSISSSRLPCSVGHHSRVRENLTVCFRDTGSRSSGPLGSSMVLHGPGSFRCNQDLGSFEKGSTAWPLLQTICVQFLCCCQRILLTWRWVMLLSCLTFTPLLVHALLAVTVVHYSLRPTASPFIPFYSLLKYLFVHSLWQIQDIIVTFRNQPIATACLHSCSDWIR